LALLRGGVQQKFTVINPTGIANTATPDIKVYPNPFKDKVYISGAEGYTLQVVNESGTIVYSQRVTSSNETIGLENMSAGVYFFRLEKDGRVKTEKVIMN
jgi:hypothetical protein